MNLDEAYKILELNNNANLDEIYKQYSRFYMKYNKEELYKHSSNYENDKKLNLISEAAEIIAKERGLYKLNTKIIKIVKLNLKEAVYGTKKNVIENGADSYIYIPPWSHKKEFIEHGRYRYILEVSKNSTFKIYDNGVNNHLRHRSKYRYVIFYKLKISKFESLFGAKKKIELLNGNYEIKIPMFSFSSVFELTHNLPAGGCYLIRVKVK